MKKQLSKKILNLIFRKVKSYLLVFVVFLFLIILAIFFILKKTNETKVQVEKLKQLSVVNVETIDSEAMAILSSSANELASFLPDEFNLYQVIALIEQIAVKTRFNIQSYALSYVEVKPDTLQQQSLALTGSGTYDQFMAFLKEYKFVTGKALTIDSVNLSGSKRILSDLKVNIYAYKPNITVDNQAIVALDKTDKLITEKIKKYYTVLKTSPDNTDYSSKENPFE